MAFLPQRTAEGSVSSSHNTNNDNNALDRNLPTMIEVCDTPITNNQDSHQGGTNSPTTVNRHYRLMKTCSVRSKRRDQYQSDNRETNDKTKPFIHIIHDD